jgi:hypothetical protein
VSDERRNHHDTTTEAAAVAEQGSHVAPEKATTKKDASRKRGAPKGPRAAKKGQENPVTKAIVAAKVIPPASKKASNTATEATEARDGSHVAPVDPADFADPHAVGVEQ